MVVVVVMVFVYVCARARVCVCVCAHVRACEQACVRVHVFVWVDGRKGVH